MSDGAIAIIVAIITGLIGPICVIISTSHTNRRDKNRDRKEQEEKEREKLVMEELHKERKAEMEQSIKEYTKPMTDTLESLIEKVDKVSDGTLSTLRNDILTCYYKCCEKGYRNDYDYQNVHHMYDSYKELNGNSYVADVVDRFDHLPTKEEYQAKHKRKTTTKKSTTKKEKMVLVEDK